MQQILDAILAGDTAARDFAAIGTAADMANVLSVNPKRLDVGSVAELAAAGKRRNLVYGSVGNGSSSHLSAATFLRGAGFEATHVPYRGSSPAVAALLAGDAEFVFSTLPQAAPLVREGRLRALATSLGERLPSAPDVPTVAEQGFPGFEAPTWWTLVGRAGTPEPVVRQMHDAMARALATPEVRDKIEENGADVIAAGPERTRRFLNNEVAKWGQVIRDNNIIVEG